MTTSTSEPDADADTGDRAVDLVRIVGEALAHRPDESRGPAYAAEARAITDAMVRLLLGTPLRSDGKLTIVALAAEAGLRRNKLTHKHTGLKDLFNALVKNLQAGRPAPDQSATRNRKQEETLTRVRSERDDLRALAQQLARVVHVLEVENRQLRTAAAAAAQHDPARTGITDLATRRRTAEPGRSDPR
ncbi:hypothetical protein [Kitasatospora purpeofusca]|uniref:hypothetical protein n=1 Tax=Kitasatospora purpeofusca TaxID=67352 RepID=UPI0035E1360E